MAMESWKQLDLEIEISHLGKAITLDFSSLLLTCISQKFPLSEAFSNPKT